MTYSSATCAPPMAELLRGLAGASTSPHTRLQARLYGAEGWPGTLKPIRCERAQRHKKTRMTSRLFAGGPR